MSEFNTLQSVLIEVVITSDKWMFKIMPDAWSAIQCTNNDAELEHCEQQHEIPSGKYRVESQPIKDRRKRTIARQCILLYPGSISNGVSKNFAWCLHKIDTNEADYSD